jgi:hypothetical protein
LALLLLLSVLTDLSDVNMIALIGARVDRADVTLILAQGFGAHRALGLTYFTESFISRLVSNDADETPCSRYITKPGYCWDTHCGVGRLAVWRGGKWTRAMVLCAGTILVGRSTIRFAAAHAKASGYPRQADIGWRSLSAQRSARRLRRLSLVGG